MMNAKELIKSKNKLEKNVAVLLQDFERSTGLIIRDIGLDRDIYNYPNQSGINKVQLEIVLP